VFNEKAFAFPYIEHMILSLLADPAKKTISMSGKTRINSPKALACNLAMPFEVMFFDQCVRAGRP
jgi:hypothetical protein